MKFREHRGGLREAMKTMVELPNRDALVTHCRGVLRRNSFWGPKTFDSAALKVTPYFGEEDTRIGWKETFLVTVEGFGILGFTDTAC